jgi:fatty acid desaturase
VRIGSVPETCRADFDAARRLAAAHVRATRADPRAAARERLSGHWLALEWLFLLVVTYALVYTGLPWWFKLTALIPWSLYAGFSLDCITHYANHWPLFRASWANAAWRLSAVAVLFNPREIHHIHLEHHRTYNRPDGGDVPYTAEMVGHSLWPHFARELLTSLRILNPLRPLADEVAALARTQPSELREVRRMRWAFPLWLALLFALDPWNTLLYFVPFVIMIGGFASELMNWTDHYPGDPLHPFRLATHCEPTTRAERCFARLNHRTAATHLTHHLFPAVHWVHLADLQRTLAPIYARHGAPRSLLLTSLIIGNPWRLYTTIRAIDRQMRARRDVA